VPLRFASYVGLFVSALALAYAVFLIVLVFVHGRDVPGYASIMVAVLFLGGVQLISIGIIGEYVGRVYDEVKQRPLYLTRELIGFEPKE
jgi:glycosyltransferase involved in cell wall biosynthesis